MGDANDCLGVVGSAIVDKNVCLRMVEAISVEERLSPQLVTQLQRTEYMFRSDVVQPGHSIGPQIYSDVCVGRLAMLPTARLCQRQYIGMNRVGL